MALMVQTRLIVRPAMTEVYGAGATRKRVLSVPSRDHVEGGRGRGNGDIKRVKGNWK